MKKMVNATNQMSHDPYFTTNRAKEIALNTLYQIKDIYENDESGLLGGAMYSDFMKELNDQIHNIRDYVND